MDGQEVTTGVRIGDRTERGDTDELKAMLVQLLHSQNELKSDIQTSTKAVQQICKVEIAETASQLRDEMEEGHRKIGEKLEGFEYKLQAVRNAAVGEQNLLKERIEQLERLPTTALSNPAAQQSPRTSLPAAASGSAQQKVKPSKFNGKIHTQEGAITNKVLSNRTVLPAEGAVVRGLDTADSKPGPRGLPTRVSQSVHLQVLKNNNENRRQKKKIGIAPLDRPRTAGYFEKNKEKKRKKMERDEGVEEQRLNKKGLRGAELARSLGTCGTWAHNKTPSDMKSTVEVRLEIARGLLILSTVKVLHFFHIALPKGP
ncbi:UNVERIFIED_CONTAM: hypothetical protein FKN15_009622 [Acipenser sinensis]